ncbi:MAG: 6-bladed beta-propeller [Nitrososphaeraceae archaeon]
MGTGADQFSETVPGIAIDTNDHVYIVDKINSRVQMFDNTGNHLSSWGSDGKGPQQLHKPEDIAVSTEGDVYVTDTRNSRIQVLNVVE